MYVIKRNGEREIVAFDKILARLKTLGQGAGITGVNYTTLVIKIIDQLYDNIPTTKIDELTAQQCAMMAVQHPDYGTLASYIIISNAHKNIPGGFYQAMRALYEYRDANNKHVPIISKSAWDFLHEIIDTPRDGSVGGSGPYLVHQAIEQMIAHERDYSIDYFGFKTLERSYLMRCNGVIVERPQHMWMRVALGIHFGRKDTASIYETIGYIQKTYDAMSQKYMTHATPTLFNAATPRPQLSSCYLIAMENDSIDGIFDTLKDCAKISKHAGGIGLHIHNIRASGSHIRGTNGASNGIVPMLRVFNNTARYIDQGGRRNGSFAVYLEPWHPDIEDFLEMKKNHGDEEMKGRDLFYALWVPDLFMERVRGGGGGGGGGGAGAGADMWSYFCPDDCPGLSDVYGDEFRELYERYEREGRARKQVKARDLWLKILDSQMETGTPYILFKDAVNKKSNQKNIGTIKSSNLCTEIMEYSDENETAVCNLASIALNRFVLAIGEDSGSNSLVASDHSVAGGDSVVSGSSVVSDANVGGHNLSNNQSSGAGVVGGRTPPGVVGGRTPPGVVGGRTPLGVVGGRTPPSFDFAELERITALLVDNLNQIIDINYYPTTKTRTSNLRHRPIGIGVQGLADVFMMMNIPFHSEEARVLNREIFETIYYAALNASMKLAARHGAYETFKGSPASEGILQFDMWHIDPHEKPLMYRTTEYDWNDLKYQIMTHGLRNSLLLAPMPTASTSQILGNNECFEPITSNIYTRRTLAGEFIMVNRYLIQDLISLGLWNERVKTNIIANQGSVQYIDGLPDALKLKYKTVWEMPMRHIIDMAADRGAFICQSQSMNLWVEEPNYNILTSMLFYAWNKGLKTGVYYLRRKAKHQAQQFTVEPEKGGSGAGAGGAGEEDDICEFCSS
jgi:ribonucleoside-diphosphate reductase alpha subunit